MGSVMGMYIMNTYGDNHVWGSNQIDDAHIAYALIGGFVTVFSLISLFVKEKLYIGEATVATIFGLIVGPHCLDWFAPTTWGNTDFITIEVSRIVLIVQIFAVAVELPKKYMLRHWLSIAILLLPVMTFGWLLSSVFIWKLVPTLSWVQGLALAACITATDPVLASAVVGKGKFARRVPGHLRNLLSAESGCNDGMAFPFAYLAVSLIRFAGDSREIAFEFIVITILYECVFGCILGAIIGYLGRHLIKFAEQKNLIDRESFLVFYFVLALFCTGVGSIIGVDDLLVSFSAGTAFSWDGWFAKKTEESHVSNVIDLLLNMAYFVYFGAIVPWDQFNNGAIGLSAWKLVILAILVLLFRRLPIMLAMKPLTPDIRTWREALFCGHFGPIGVGAVFISILIRAELEHGEPTPLATLPPPGSPNYYAVATIWPVTTFLIISSIVVHGSSIAVFTLGKRLNNMTLTMTYTTNGPTQSWLSRLPRIEGGRTLSLHKVDTDDPSRFKFGKAKPSAGGGARRRRKTPPESLSIDLGRRDQAGEGAERDSIEPANLPEDPGVGVVAPYQEGSHLILEDHDGEVVATVDEADKVSKGKHSGDSSTESSATAGRSDSGHKHPHQKRGQKITAYQLDNDIIVENEDGDIIRRYRINRRSSEVASETSTQPRGRSGSIIQGLDRTLSWVGLKKAHEQHSNADAGSPTSPISERDVEKNEGDIVPVGTASGQLPFDDDTMKKHLHALLGRRDSIRDNVGPKDMSSTAPAPPRSFLGHHDGEDEDPLTSSADPGYDETEVERKRRLAALGLLSEGEDDDDEEHFGTTSSPRRLNNRIGEEEEDGIGPYAGIKWSSDVK
jgi:sodium/hydrogen antiporter